MDSATTTTRGSWGWAACRQIGRGWASCHDAALPADPVLLNYGLFGIMAFAASLAWFVLLDGPLSRLPHLLPGG